MPPTPHPHHEPHGFALGRYRAVLAFLASITLALTSAPAEVIFSRSTSTGEGWAAYSASFTPTQSGNYTLSFTQTAGGPSGDNSILIDAVSVTSGSTTVFSDGFETPAIATNGGISSNGSTATIGNWRCTHYSGILDGSPANWGLAAQGLGSADGTTQYAYIQAVFGGLSSIKATNTLSLVAGQTYTVSFYQASRRDFGGTTTYTVSLDYVPPTVYASGLSPVIAWDPIFPSAPVVPDSNEAKPAPTVGYDDPRWTNPHNATVFPKNSHVWEYQSWVPSVFKFDAHWINAWSSLGSSSHGKTSSNPAWANSPYYGTPNQSWTKYSTLIEGSGSFVLQFFADNASWIYLDGELVGYQDYNWVTNGTGRYTINLSGGGQHELAFIIWDGGGLAGGKFRIETLQSFIDNNPGIPLPPPPPADTTAPVISAPASLTTEATGPLGATVTFSATANDNIDGNVPVSAAPASGSVFPLGTTAVGLAASDAAGNTATASFDITVRDTTAPVIAAPANVGPIEATGPTGAAVTFTPPVANDIVDGVRPVTATPASGSTFPLGTTAVTLSSSDTRSNTSSRSFSVTVVDTTAPVIAAPANITAEATSAAGATVGYSASAADLVAGSVAVTGTPASGSTFPLGTTTVTVTATDVAGNRTTASFAVTVRDTIAPSLTVPANQVIEATSAAGAIASYAASATDAVGVTAINYSIAPGSQFPLGTTTVSVKASDAAGNVTSGSFTVTVRDTTAPTISSLTANPATLWPVNHKLVNIQLSASATDLVGVTSLRIVNVTSSEPDDGCGDGDTPNDIQITGDLTLKLRAERDGRRSGRTYTITVEARDAAGNATLATTTVSVPKSQGGGKDDDRHDDKGGKDDDRGGKKGSDHKDDGKKDDRDNRDERKDGRRG